MKRIVLLSATLLAISSSIFAQVGINTINPDSSAALEVQSSTSGFLPPRVTKVQMTAIVNPAEGLMVYCTNCVPKGIYTNNGNGFLSTMSDAPSGTPYNAIKDRLYGDGFHDFIYMPVVSATGKTWLNNNLGAIYAKVGGADYNPAKQATAYNDYKAYGSLYQWGRGSDRHELINWTSATTGIAIAARTTTLSIYDVPVNDNFIKAPNNPKNWRTPKNDNLWQGVNGANNPCPSGYRIPTNLEYTAEIAMWSATNAAGAMASSLKLTSSGDLSTMGVFYDVSSYGLYWSNTVGTISNTKISVLRFNASTALMAEYDRANGFPVRCIKD